jgi:hypothetical protein
MDDNALCLFFPSALEGHIKRVVWSTLVGDLASSHNTRNRSAKIPYTIFALLLRV